VEIALVSAVSADHDPETSRQRRDLHKHVLPPDPGPKLSVFHPEYSGASLLHPMSTPYSIRLIVLPPY
jgi:hypothetical protein